MLWIAKAARLGFSVGMPLPEDIDDLTPAELKALVPQLLERRVELDRTIAAYRDEIARLKGAAPRPNITPNITPSKPNGIEQAADSKPPKPPEGCSSGQ